MLITLRNQSLPISVVDLYQAKRTLKKINPFFKMTNKILKNNFKQTAFYSFFQIASADPDKITG